MRRDEVGVVGLALRLLELVEETFTFVSNAGLLTLEDFAVDRPAGEHVHDPVLLLVQGDELGLVGLHGVRLCRFDLPVGLVEADRDRLGDVLGHGDGIYDAPELVEDVLFTDVHLRLATPHVDPLAVGAAVVVVDGAVRLLLRRVGDLAAAGRVRAPEREKPLGEEAVVFQFALGRAEAERGLELRPLFYREDRVVLPFVADAPPHELALEVVVTVGDGGVERRLEVLIDRGPPVRRDALEGDKTFGDADVPDAVEAVPLEMKIHLPSDQQAAFFGRTDDRTAAPLHAAVLVDERLLDEEGRGPARVPAVHAPLDHSVDGLPPSGPILLLGLGDVDVRHEEAGVVAVLVKHHVAGGNVEDDLAALDQLFEHLKVGVVSAHPIEHVEDEVTDLQALTFLDGRMELGPQLRRLRRLLERRRVGDDQVVGLSVLPQMPLLGVERHPVQLFPIADAADEHGPTVRGIPPRGLLIFTSLRTHRSPSSYHSFKIRNTSTSSATSSAESLCLNSTTTPVFGSDREGDTGSETPLSAGIFSSWNTLGLHFEAAVPGGRIRGLPQR